MGRINKLKSKCDLKIKEMYQLVNEANRLGQATVIAAILAYLKELSTKSNTLERTVITKIVMDIDSTFMEDEVLSNDVTDVLRELLEADNEELETDTDNGNNSSLN